MHTHTNLSLTSYSLPHLQVRADQQMSEAQLTELKAINKSLGTLASVVNALVEKSRREKRSEHAGGAEKNVISNSNPEHETPKAATGMCMSLPPLHPFSPLGGTHTNLLPPLHTLHSTG